MAMGAPLDSELLKTLVAIAESGSFTAAAERVGRTQSAVSMQMKRLEGAAGQSLFERRPRGVGLTPAGERLLTDARRILRLLDEAARALAPDPLTGAIRIGVPEEYGAELLPRILAHFAARNPQVEVTVVCAPSPAVEDDFARGNLDVAVVVLDDDHAPGELLLHDPTHWVASARHLCHEDDPLPLALYDRGCWWRDWALRVLDEQGRHYRIAYSSASTAGIQAAVASGLAVGVLGRSMLPQGARILTAAEGFPALPGSDVTLKLRSAGASPAVEGMAAAFRSAFRGATPPTEQTSASLDVIDED